MLARVTARRLSAFYEKVHRDAGVDVRTGVQVARGSSSRGRHSARRAVAGRGRRPRLHENRHRRRGRRRRPNVELAQAAGLACAPDGMVGRRAVPHIRPFDRRGRRLHQPPGAGPARHCRIESVPNAAEQARTAAATLCGQHQPCHRVPWFWSDQYDLKLQMVGLSRGPRRRGDPRRYGGPRVHGVLPQSGHDDRGGCGQPPRRFHAGAQVVAAGAQVGPGGAGGSRCRAEETGRGMTRLAYSGLDAVDSALSRFPESPHAD